MSPILVHCEPRIPIITQASRALCHKPEPVPGGVLRGTKTISRSDSHPSPEKFALRIPTHTTPHTLRACACRFAWVASRSRHLWLIGTWSVWSRWWWGTLSAGTKIREVYNGLTQWNDYLSSFSVKHKNY